MLHSGHFCLIVFMCFLVDQEIAGKSEITADTIGASSTSSTRQLAEVETNVEPSIMSPIMEDNHTVKMPPEQLECIADYLVKAKGVKTEIFAEKWLLNSWRMKRAVVRQQKMEKWRLYEWQMVKEMGEHHANKCFTLNRELLSIQHTTDEQGKKTVKFFVRIWDLFDRSANGHLQVSDDLNNKLGKQSECLASFLAENFDAEHLQLEKLHKTAELSQDDAILEANKVKWRVDNELLRWKWSAGYVEEDQQQKMPEISIGEGTPHFNSLKRCFSLLPIKNGIRNNGIYDKSFMELKPMLARFREDQLFVRKMPKKNKNFIIGNLALLKLKEKYECPICFSEFVPCDEVQKLCPCNNLFHKYCIEEWLKTHETCPMCRRTLVYRRHRWWKFNSPFFNPTPEQAQHLMTVMQNHHGFKK